MSSYKKSFQAEMESIFAMAKSKEEYTVTPLSVYEAYANLAVEYNNFTKSARCPEHALTWQRLMSSVACMHPTELHAQYALRYAKILKAEVEKTCDAK